MTSATFDSRNPEAAAARLESLEPVAQRQGLRALSAKDRLNVILAARDPAALVRCLEPEDFFFTLHEIGIADAPELIQLSTPEQLGFCLDLECWSAGRLETQRLDRWFEQLGEIGRDELYRTIEHLDLEVLISFFHGRMHVLKRDEDTDAVEISDPALRTLDDLYYFSFPGTSPEDDRRLSSTIGLIRERSLQLYLDVLESVMGGLVSQAEEDALRLRNGRMLDHGFPDYDSALGLYAYVDPRDFDASRHAKALISTATIEEPEKLGSELEPRRIGGDSFLAEVLATVAPEQAAALREELAYLIHRAVVTEVQDVSRPSELRRVARDVMRHVSIGLEHLSGRNVTAARELALGTRLAAILGVSFGLITVLRHRRERLVAHPRFEAMGDRGSDVLGSPIAEMLDALAPKQPTYALALDLPDQDGVRPFRTLEDLGRVGAALTQAEALTLLLFDRMLPEGSEMPSDPDEDLTLDRMLTTVLAHTVLGEEPSLTPISGAALNELHRRAFDPHPGGPVPIRPEALASFETWLEEALEGFPDAWSLPVRRFSDACVDRLAEELGPIDASEPIDPRFLSCLWLGPLDDDS